MLYFGFETFPQKNINLSFMFHEYICIYNPEKRQIEYYIQADWKKETIFFFLFFISFFFFFPPNCKKTDAIFCTEIFSRLIFNNF